MMQSTSSMKFLVRATAFAVPMLAAVALAPLATSASTVHSPMVTHALLGGKEKSVRFSLRNQTGAPIDLVAGDKTMTLAPGQTMDVKLPVGTRITTAGKTGRRDAGALICVVSAATADTTVVLN